MSKAVPSLGAGDVPITLDGEDVVLRPTLKAAQAISRMSGGIAQAVERVGRYDFDTISDVVALGLDVSAKDAKDLPERVYRTGLTNLSGPVIRYLSIIANGGRPAGEASDDDENPPKASG